MPTRTSRVAILLWGLTLATSITLVGWHLYRSDRQAIADRAGIRERLVIEQVLTRQRLIDEQALTRQRLIAEQELTRDRLVTEQALTRREVAKWFRQLHDCLHPGHPWPFPTGDQ